jgi:hypothetical protein
MRILGVLYGAGRYRLEQEEEYDAHLGRAHGAGRSVL